MLYEAVADYKKGPLAANVPRLKVFWIAKDFDADNESSRQTVRDQLCDEIANDVLLNVVLGRLNAADARRLARGGTSHLLGLELAMLATIEIEKFISVNSLAKSLSTSAATVKVRLERLLGTRLLDEEGHSYAVTTAGRAMLRICAELFVCQVRESATKPAVLAVDDELSYILGLLEQQPVYARRPGVDSSLNRDYALRDVLWMLAREASHRWDVTWEDLRLQPGIPGKTAV